VNRSHEKTAAFVRGFFLSLEQCGHRAAVLHGGEDGFGHELSDVDFVIERSSYKQLATLINAYCEDSGWFLCQILRHETTAAYFVCSAAEDPTCAVALDACSDYQRNGTVFLRADELLTNTQILPWGGRGLKPAMQLRYRFAKASAKNKDIIAVATEFNNYPVEDRQICETWLKNQWRISLSSWDSTQLDSALVELRKKSNPRPSLLQVGAQARILSRILHPSGLVVIAGHLDFDGAAARLESVFGHLYFRRFRQADRWQPFMIKDLVTSTLIVVPELGFPWLHLIPKNCLHRLDHSLEHATQLQALAGQLHQRCRQRETPLS
jgi:hypothetical protein